MKFKKLNRILLANLFLFLVGTYYSYGQSNKLPNSKINGVQIGLITYSWRSMPGSAQDIIKYCQQTGINSLELMGNVAEEYAGIPKMPARPKRNTSLSDEEKESYKKSVEKAREKQRLWRLSVSMDKYKELKNLFDKAGIEIHIVKFSPAKWTDEEIDYAFNTARTLGAVGITNEIGHDACKRLGKFAEKHEMYAIFHNHAQPGQPNFSFEEFLAYSPNNMLNLDVGHYYGATGKHPNEIIKKLHSRIISLHLKDKTGKNDIPPNKNEPWGEGGTPLHDILKLIEKNNWPIYCDVEVEYDIPDDSDAVIESKKCLDYCKKGLL